VPTPAATESEPPRERVPAAAMRIALVAVHSSPVAGPGRRDAGGMNVYLLETGRALAARGHEVELVTRAEGPDEPALERIAAGLSVRRIEAGPRSPVRKESLAAIVDDFGTALAGLPAFDVIHAHYWLSGLAAQRAARAGGTPFALTLHTVAALKQERRGRGEAPEPVERIAAERRLCAEADAVVAIAPAEREAIARLYGRPAERIELARPGVDAALFHPGHRTQPRPYLAMVARLQPLKGVELAIDAIAALPAGRRPALRVAGAPTPGAEAYPSALRARARARGVTLQLEGTLSRRQVAELLRGAQLALVPSRTETFGLVALEAAASGVPVLGASVDGLRDSVCDGRSGVLVRGRDPRRWARALQGLLADPVRRARLGRDARAHALTHGWASTARALEAVYTRLREAGERTAQGRETGSHAAEAGSHPGRAGA